MRKGFTLLEGLVAMILMVIALPAITSLFMGAKSSQVGSFAVEQGAQFAESRIDSLRWLGRTALVAGTWSSPQATTLNMKGATWKWRMDLPATAGQAGTITVEVDWNQGDHAHSISLQGEVQ